ncbi:unnamed protein product [Closterium sp. NIES-65]|nr:unnamed protein product [Closterium sp. NIES-65]
MQTILSLGNALNQGTARGSAVGFKLDSLLKLTDTKTRNNKMTLMHYLAKLDSLLKLTDTKTREKRRVLRRLKSLLKLTDTKTLNNNKMTLMHYLAKVLTEKLPELALFWEELRAVLTEKLPELALFWEELPSLEDAHKIQVKQLGEEMGQLNSGTTKLERAVCPILSLLTLLFLPPPQSDSSEAAGRGDEPAQQRHHRAGALNHSLVSPLPSFPPHPHPNTSHPVQIQVKQLGEEMGQLNSGTTKLEREMVASEKDGPVSENFRTVRGSGGWA